MAKIPESRDFDRYIPACGPFEYVAVMLPTPKDNVPRRSMLEKEKSLTDLNVYLDTKALSTIEQWAKEFFTDLVAKRMSNYLRRRDTKELATLTPHELYKLEEMMVKHGKKQR